MSLKDKACNSLKRKEKVMDENTFIIVEAIVKTLGENK